MFNDIDSRNLEFEVYFKVTGKEMYEVKSVAMSILNKLIKQLNFKYDVQQSKKNRWHYYNLIVSTPNGSGQLLCKCILRREKQ